MLIRYASAAEGEHKSRGGSSIGFVAGPIGVGVPLESYWHRSLVENAAVHCAAHVSKYSLSAIQVNIPRCLHELAKETDRIAEIGSSDREVDETPDELPILSRLTRFGAGVRI